MMKATLQEAGFASRRTSAAPKRVTLATMRADAVDADGRERG